MGVQAMKHAALLQEWSARIAECRTSGKSVKAWCNEQGIPIKTYYYWEKKFVTEAIQQVSLPSSRQAGLLMQVNPDAMLGSNVADIGTGVTIRHGESVITLPSGTVLETAKANGLNPEAYLNHLLTVLPERFAADPQSPVDNLMPWIEEMQKSFRVSDVEH